ncbi:MAG: hypothetical protein AAF328_00330 [Planctomycetota bacterium]
MGEFLGSFNAFLRQYVFADINERDFGLRDGVHCHHWWLHAEHGLLYRYASKRQADDKIMDERTGCMARQPR